MNLIIGPSNGHTTVHCIEHNSSITHTNCSAAWRQPNKDDNQTTCSGISQWKLPNCLLAYAPMPLMAAWSSGITVGNNASFHAMQSFIWPSCLQSQRAKPRLCFFWSAGHFADFLADFDLQPYFEWNIFPLHQRILKESSHCRTPKDSPCNISSWQSNYL